MNISIDISQAPAAFPQPVAYTWTRNGVQLSDITLIYSTITFASVSRTDARSYVVSATKEAIQYRLGVILAVSAWM